MGPSALLSLEAHADNISDHMVELLQKLHYYDEHGTDKNAPALYTPRSPPHALSSTMPAHLLRQLFFNEDVADLVFRK